MMEISPCAERVQPVQLRLPLRLFMAVTRVSATEALNCGDIHERKASALVLADFMHAAAAIDNVAIDSQANRVNYHKLRHDSVYTGYTEIADSLRHFDPGLLSGIDERLAFWINLYNLLIIHAVIHYGVERTVNEVTNVFDRAAYIVGGYRYSANDIEHGILRANAGHPLIPGRQFRDDDPRLAYALESVDTRVHIALVCAAKSCPPINTYTADDLDEKLDWGARWFVEQRVTLNRAEMTIALSPILSWYAVDFGASWYGYRRAHKLVEWVAPYIADEDDRAYVQANSHNLRVRFTGYDWSLNTYERTQ